jgi:acetyl esterase/lipase
MSRHVHSAVLAAAVGLLGFSTPANAAAPLVPLLNPPPPAANVIAPVAGLMSADPAGTVRGTMMMVHAGGWAGHDAGAQRLLMRTPGDMLLARGWRVVSIDYNEGTAGLQDVLDAAGAELTRGAGDGPLCIYGESAGAHLALVAASRLRAIDCVIALGGPTDLLLYEAEAAASSDSRLGMVADQMKRFFGATAPDVAPWDPVALAPSIHADVLLLREGDDTMVTASHNSRFQAASPTAVSVELQAGDPAIVSTRFVHGTISASGRATYAAAIGALADRALVARRAQRDAGLTGCAQVSRSVGEIRVSGLRSALRCLARNDQRSRRASVGGWRRTTTRMHGQVNAARMWAALRATGSGRRALLAVARRRASVSVRSGVVSLVTVRRAR